MARAILILTIVLVAFAHLNTAILNLGPSSHGTSVSVSGNVQASTSDIFKTVQTQVTTLQSQITPLIQAIINDKALSLVNDLTSQLETAVQGLVSKVGDILGTELTGLITTITSTLGNVVQLIPTVLGVVTSLVSSLLEDLPVTLTGVLTALLPDLANLLNNLLTGLLAKVEKIVTELVKQLDSVLAQKLTLVFNTVNQVFELLNSKIPDVLKILGVEDAELLTDVLQLVGKLQNAVVQLLVVIVTNVDGLLSLIAGTLGKLLMDGTMVLKSILGKLGSSSCSSCVGNASGGVPVAGDLLKSLGLGKRRRRAIQH